VLMPASHRIALVLRLRSVIWRRAAASNVIWRGAIGFRPRRARFRHESAEESRGIIVVPLLREV